MHIPNFRFGALLFLAIAFAAPFARAQIVGIPDQPPPAVEAPVDTTIHLQITPALPSSPALKYRFFIRPVEQERGNAAPLYLKAAILLSESKRDEKFWDNIDDWSKTPPADLPRDKVREALRPYETVLKLVRQAAHREDCHWESTIREDSYFELLPEVGHLRSFVHLLALKARLQIAEKDFDGALETIQTGLAVAQSMALGRTLIHGLVAISSASSMLDQAREISQVAGGPNLYWSLTALPKPFVDFRRAFETEGDFVLFTFPQLRDLDRLSLSREGWDARLQDYLKQRNLLYERAQVNRETAHDVAATLELIAVFPFARQWMIDSGVKPDVVDQKSASEIFLKYTAHITGEMSSQLYRWLYLPYPEAREWLLAAKQDLAKGNASREQILPLASFLLEPAVHMVYRSSTKLDRQFAAQRCVEALRMYAAANKGVLPEKLSDIKEVPIPSDPMTGKPFEYRLEKEQALLIGPPPDGKSWEVEGLRYEIRIAK